MTRARVREAIVDGGLLLLATAPTAAGVAVAALLDNPAVGVAVPIAFWVGALTGLVLRRLYPAGRQ